MTDRVAIRRALISVTDKSGVADLAKRLIDAGAEIVSSGGTAQALREAGLTVSDVSELTGFPEMLDGRVKTLHPTVHAGILADRSNPEHLATLEEHGIGQIDLVCVNLYAFDTTVTDETADADAIKQIDVGGPTMIRAAAKNFEAVTVVTDPADYDRVAEEAESGGVTRATRRRLAGKAFARLSAYDSTIGNWFDDDELPPRLNLALNRQQVLRYGENPHQMAALYSLPGEPYGISSAQQLQGKEMSYINWLDCDSVLRIVSSFDEPTAVIVKHTNPCGAASGSSIEDAYNAAFECDPRSAFGGIVGLNRECSTEVAESMQREWTGSPFFLECVVAPGFSDGAREIFATKKNLRLLEMDPDRVKGDRVKVASVSGGVLIQTADPATEGRDEMEVVTQRTPSEDEWSDLLFAWRICSHVKSNAIVLANLRHAVGVGAGQMSRVESMQIAITRAGDRAKGSVAASEALFPFADSIETAEAAGITAIIQPGGSVRDSEVIDAADRAGIAMVFTKTRHFLH